MTAEPMSVIQALTPTSWGELASLFTVLGALIASLIGGITWGLHLEWNIKSLADKVSERADKQDRRLEKIEAILEKGILVVTEARMRTLEIQIQEIKDDRKELKEAMGRIEEIISQMLLTKN